MLTVSKPDCSPREEMAMEMTELLARWVASVSQSHQTVEISSFIQILKQKMKCFDSQPLDNDSMTHLFDL